MNASWLVVNADDLGVSRGTTLGIIQAHREGIVTSASLATTTPYYEHAVQECVRTCPELGIGLHFTLTSGRPTSASHEVSLLTDPSGYFRWRFLPLLSACNAPGSARLLDQIEHELESQLTRLRQDGIRADHINGERHVHLIPAIFDRVVAVAQRHDIGFVRVGRDYGARLLAAHEVPRLMVNGGVAKWSLLSVFSNRNRRRLRSPIRTPDHVASYLFTGRTGVFLPRLLRAPVEGITEVMVHPAIPGDGAGADLGNRELERYVQSQDRRAELDACIAARGQTGAWQLTTYGRLAREGKPC